MNETTKLLVEQYKQLWKEYMSVSVVSKEAYAIEKKLNPIIRELESRGIKEPWNVKEK
jgi:hypothetical protein